MPASASLDKSAAIAAARNAARLAYSAATPEGEPKPTRNWLNLKFWNKAAKSPATATAEAPAKPVAVAN